MNNVIPSLRYALLTLKHKYYVYLAGRKLRVPIWQLIIHDLSKFSRAELPAYGRQFFGTKDRPHEFGRAWEHHWQNNPHHWEWWANGKFEWNPATKNTVLTPIEMPEKYVREMIADWMGASRAYAGKFPSENLDEWEWFQKNFNKIKLHPATRKRVLKILAFELLYHGKVPE